MALVLAIDIIILLPKDKMSLTRCYYFIDFISQYSKRIILLYSFNSYCL